MISPCSKSILSACWLLSAVLTVSACTNSKLLLKPLYNRLDDSLDDSVLEFVKLDATQTETLNAITDAFHDWHRQSQLTKYADLLIEVADTLNSPGVIEPEFTLSLKKRTKLMREQLLSCHPVHYSAGLIGTLDASQIDAIELGYGARRAAKLAERSKLPASQRFNTTLKKTRKWMARAQLKLDAEQADQLAQSLRQHRQPGPDFREKMQAWHHRFFNLLHQSDASDFEARLKESVQARWSLYESINPDVAQHNQALWQAYAQQLLESLSTQQRDAVAKWSRKMAAILEDLAEAKPNLEKPDPALGCADRL